MAITEWANWIARHGQACGALGALIACAPFDHGAGRAPSPVTGMPSLIFAGAGLLGCGDGGRRSPELPTQRTRSLRQATDCRTIAFDSLTLAFLNISREIGPARFGS